MNYAIVFRLLGYVMLIEGALLLLPAAASWIYGEWFVLGVFLITAAVSAAIGYALRGIKPQSKVFYMREGFAATSLSWIVISIVGAVPFVVTGCIPNPVDALFETVSGFTTTGASILPGVEDLPKGILFWRSFTHWIGGMGVLVFLLSLLPLTGGSHVNLMKAESPGPQVDKLVPKVQSTAKILYGIYLHSPCWRWYSCCWAACRCLSPCSRPSVRRAPAASASRTTALRAFLPTSSGS